MSEQTSISASRSIDAPASTVFDILTNPERHHEFDAAGMVKSLDKGKRIQATGEVFTMNMNAEHMGGDYKTDNYVTGFEPDKLVAWETAPAGEQPAGWEWVWEVTSTGSDSADVTLTYDWSKVDAATVKKIGLPLLTLHDLQESLNKLASAVTGS